VRPADTHSVLLAAIAKFMHQIKLLHRLSRVDLSLRWHLYSPSELPAGVDISKLSKNNAISIDHGTM
jgi:hypothetical protein